MEKYILHEGVLNDNELILSDEGKVFKGGYIAIIKEYTFLNSWCNKESIKKFRKHKQMHDYLKRFYPNFNINN